MQFSLTRLRWSFVVLAVLLSAALALLVESALDRLAHQRALRHEVVAERIFDELERELTAYLLLESARPSAAYDTPTSQVQTWAPFVVGYFKVDDAYRVVSREQLTPTRAARIERALATVWPRAVAPSVDRLPRPPITAQPLPDSAPLGSVEKSGDPQVPALGKMKSRKESSKKLESSPDVLRRLNRAQEERMQQQKPQKPAPAELADPFGF